MFRLLLIAAILIVNTISTTCRADDNKNDKDDDILSTNLITWLRDNGAYINDKLVVKHNGVYRGIYATQDMEVGEQLCSIPSHLMIQPTEELMENENTIYPHCNTIKEVMKALSTNDDNTNPYGEYLKAQPIGYLPTFWSNSAKGLLVTMLKSTRKEHQTDLEYYGLEYDELPPHGIQYKLDEIQYECDIDNDMMNDPTYKQAAMLVTARGDYEYMIPYYDMFNHNNAKYNIHHDYTLDDTPEKRGFTVSKPIKAGEELFNAYNRCNICNDRLDWYGTPEMWLEYGFIESIPQRWLFDFARVKFELEWKDGDESSGEVVVNFLVPMSSRGKRLLQEELTRLDIFADMHRGKSYQEYGDMTKFEWESLWQYYDALHNALTLATTQSDVSLSDEVWKLGHDWWVQDGTLKEEDSEEHYVLRTKSSTNDELYKDKNTMMNDGKTFPVRTILDKPPQPKETDISKMNEDDLKLLKRNDPFLYNSIPSINKAKLTNETVDHSKVIRDAVSQPSSAVVSRKSRVSTESAASVMVLVDEYLRR